MPNCENFGRNVTVIGPVKWITDEEDHIDIFQVGTYGGSNSTTPETPDIIIHKTGINKNKNGGVVFQPVSILIIILMLVGLFVHERRKTRIRSQLGDVNVTPGSSSSCQINNDAVPKCIDDDHDHDVSTGSDVNLYSTDENEDEIENGNHESAANKTTSSTMAGGALDDGDDDSSNCGGLVIA